MSTFDRTPGSPATCRTCGYAEPEHLWLCDSCHRSLATGATRLPPLHVNHGGATLFCPVGDAVPTAHRRAPRRLN